MCATPVPQLLSFLCAAATPRSALASAVAPPLLAARSCCDNFIHRRPFSSAQVLLYNMIPLVCGKVALPAMYISMQEASSSGAANPIPVLNQDEVLTINVIPKTKVF